jgi:hypothetical protein
MNIFNDAYHMSVKGEKNIYLVVLIDICSRHIFKNSTIAIFIFLNKNLSLVRVVLRSHTEKMRCMYQRMKKRGIGGMLFFFSEQLRYLLECQLFK